MLLKLLQTGNPVLRKKAKALTEQQLLSREIQELIDLMIKTLRDAPGVGLAASQVGESIRLIVIDDRAEYHDQVPEKVLKEQNRKPTPLTIIANPELKVIGTATALYFEGCLSVEGYVAAIPRATKVIVSGLDRNGKLVEIKASGWQARILQHEIEHLNGGLYIDQMITKSFMSQKNFNLKWRKALQAEIKAAFMHDR
jgi:peptide deformylase